MSGRLDPRQRVLVRLPSWLGDLVMAEPVVRALHDEHRRAGTEERLSLAAPGRLLEVFEGRFPGARRLPFRAGRRMGKGGNGGAENARDWRGHDVALLCTGSFRSAWAALVAGIPRRVGWGRDGRSPLLTEALAPARERGRVPFELGRAGRWPRFLPRPFGTDCVELARFAGLEVLDARPRLEPAPAALERVAARLAGGGLTPADPYVLVNVGARPGSAKGYPAASWGRVLAELARAVHLPQVLVCGPGEEAGAREALERAGEEGGGRRLLLDDPPAGLAELVALAGRARLALSADSGPRHVMAAAGAPVVALCGPTDPRHSADHLERVRILRVPVPCGPCHLERCPLPRRPSSSAEPEPHGCMLGIEPGRVVAAARELLR